jgi:ABC-type transporter Mla MlaB component
MGGFFSALLAKLAGMLGWIGELFVAVFTAAWDMLTDVVCWVFEQCMTVVVSAISGIDTSSLSSTAWGSLPTDVVNVMQLVGVGTAVGIIGAAIGIRLLLQLIPFTRLGS